MKVQLIVWRHAEAEDGIPDDGRRLTAKGRRQARCVARWLERQLGKPRTMLVSPARRAQETAAALASRFEICAAIGVGSSPREILSAARWPGDDDRIVIVVGHQPALGEAVMLALARKALPLGLKKGAFIWLESRARGRSREVLLRAAASPDLLG